MRFPSSVQWRGKGENLSENVSPDYCYKTTCQTLADMAIGSNVSNLSLYNNQIDHWSFNSILTCLNIAEYTPILDYKLLTLVYSC